MFPQTSRSAIWKSSGSPSSIPTKSGGSGATLDIASPSSSAGTATRNPAKGPATPISNSAALVVNRLPDTDERRPPCRSSGNGIGQEVGQ